MRERSSTSGVRSHMTPGMTSTVAEIAKPALDEAAPPLPLAVRWWDGSETRYGEPDATIVVRSPHALRRLLYQPNELGLSRAFVAGEVDVEGDIFALLDPPPAAGVPRRRLGARAAISLWRAAVQLKAVGPPIPPPPEEARIGGSLHSRRRDAQAIAHHYDVGNDFYRLVLGRHPDVLLRLLAPGGDDARRGAGCEARPDLPQARAAAGHAHARRRLWLGQPRDPCRAHLRGHAPSASRCRASRSASPAQRVIAAGVEDRVEIRRQDYRELGDALVRRDQQRRDVRARRGRTDGRVLRSTVRAAGAGRDGCSTTPSRARTARAAARSAATRSWRRYVFPDGELLEVGARRLGHAGRRVRGTRRRVAARALRAHAARLGREPRTRPRRGRGARGRCPDALWRLYMAASAVAFERDRPSIHQVLAVRPDGDGSSRMPPTREWLAQ